MNPADLIEKHFRLLPAQRRGLDKLGLKTIEDLLFFWPSRYTRQGEGKTIAELTAGEAATIYGRLTKPKISKGWKSKIPMAEAVIEDATGNIKAIWFHQAYMVKKYPEGMMVELSGKVAERKDALYMANPMINQQGGDSGPSLFSGPSEGKLATVYPETRGLSSNWLSHAIEKILTKDTLKNLADPLPPEILKRYHLPNWHTAIVWIHRPEKEADAIAARKRFSFDEVFFLQLARLRDQHQYREQGAFAIKTDPKMVSDFVSRFAFPLTGAQSRAIAAILGDFGRGQPMTRLLEGDVGSGKTAVAAATAFAAAEAGYEVAYMAPTEILARQHFESFINYFRHRPIQIAYISGAGCRKFPSKLNPGGWTDISRAQLLKWVANGEIKMVIGTHALITETVKFKNLAYAIIDEQHRFGVKQRAKLLAKNSKLAPHLLSMTATPIPRTLALTVYGDLDLTVLDELPPGRRPIKTEIVGTAGRSAVYEAIRRELAAGRQAYVICPRIDDPDPAKAMALQARSAKTEATRLAEKVFPDYTVGLLHSKLKPKDKEEVINDFTNGDINILVSTSVVEVGVNVPNATIIAIEGAERFGLAQLHQLRGRVLRSAHQAYCYLMTEQETGKGAERLAAVKTATNGFALAEMDLTLRGAGSLAGDKQWGLSDVGMEALQNLKLVEAARAEAKQIIDSPGGLAHYPLLAARVARTPTHHLE